MVKNTGRSRRPRNSVTTKSGNTLKVNQSISDRVKSRRAARSADKAAYLSTLPKDRLKRVLYRLHPKRVAQYWFSRQGGIMALKIIGISIIVGFFMTIGLFAYFRKDLPKIKDLSGGSLGGNVIYYDRTGQTVLFNDYDSIKRLPVEGKAISKYIKQATIAIEDKDFYNHGAFDVRGIMRAGYNDITGTSGSVQGGSTITQQLVKLNQNWTDNRTITRKVKELILAVELEREYSKDDILTGYLNIAPYSGQDYGVEAAARDYFQVSAKDLTLAQSVMLAAIPQAPTYYSPYASNKYNSAVTGEYFNEGALVGRMSYILDQMAKQGYITKKQAAETKKVDILAQIHPQSDKYKDIKAPYFFQAAKSQLEQIYGSTTVQRGGWKVITTLDMNLQNKSEELVATNLPKVSRFGADTEAMVAEDVQTGQIVALVGGTDFNNPDHGQNNFAASIKLPPGSSFKPYDYAALIDNNNNVGAGSVLYDTKGAIPGYTGTCTFIPSRTKPCPEGTLPFLYDYDFKFPGPVTLRYALGGSRNVPAVKAMMSTVPNDKSKGKTDSINKTISTASAMMDNRYMQSKKVNPYNCYADEKNEETTQCYGAAAIGDGAFLHLDDHVNGLATLGRMGKAIPRTYLLKITDAAGKNVPLPVHKPKQAIKADTAFIVNSMASDPKASYLPGSCTDTTCTALARGGYKFHRFNGWQFAVKTGTTNDGYDGLMTSWSTKYAVVTWVGHNTRNVTLRNNMETLTEPMARGFMEFAHQNEKPVNWTQPSTIKSAPAFVVRSHVGIGSIEPSPTNDLFPGWYTPAGNVKNTSQTLDKVSGKVATSCTPPLAKENQFNANVASWNIDIFNGGRTSTGTTNKVSTTSSPTDDVHNCNDSPPTITLTAPASCDISCTITATVTQGTHPLSDSNHSQFPGTVTFKLGDQVINTQNVSESPSTISFNYNPTSSGSAGLTASVTDSVLYQGTDSTTLNFTVAPAGPSGFTAIISGNIINFSWAGGKAPYSVYRNDNNFPLCSNVAANSCQHSKNDAPSGTAVTLKDADNNNIPATVN